jgi:hypothetical protein
MDEEEEGESKNDETANEYGMTSESSQGKKMDELKNRMSVVGTMVKKSK